MVFMHSGLESGFKRFTREIPILQRKLATVASRITRADLEMRIFRARVILRVHI